MADTVSPNITPPAPLREPLATTGAPALAGRSWQLCKRYPKQTILAVLPTVVIMSLYGLTLGIIQYLKLSKQFDQVLLMMGLGVIACLFLLLGSISSYISHAVLSRFYFSAIFFEKPIALKECYSFVFKNGLALFLNALMLLLVGIVFFTIDMVLLIILFAVGSFLVALTTVSAKVPIVMVGLFAVYFIIGTLTFALIWSVLSTQIVVLNLPLVILANADTDLSNHPSDQIWIDHLGSNASDYYLSLQPKFGQRPSWAGIIKIWQDAFKAVFSQFPRALLYGSVIMVFLTAWNMIWNLPLTAWYTIEVIQSRLGHSDKSTLFMVLSSVIQVWSGFTSSLIIPLSTSAATVFWYDSKVRKEGFDLRIWLTRLRERWYKRQHPSS